MSVKAQPRHLPDIERLSVLAATILLAYALARFVNLPLERLAIQLPGFLLTFEIKLDSLITLLVALLTAAGANWLLSDHPARARQNMAQHLLLPALTAWVIGVPLFQLPIGLLWWVGYALGGTILIMVLVAEYIVLDAKDIRQPLAAAGLTVISFALFLILSVSLRFTGLRLFLLVPALTLAAGLVSMRTLNLRLHGRWAFYQAGIVAVIIGQLVAAFHYWPLSPVAYGLVLLAPAYGLTNLMGSLIEEMPWRQAIVEPVIIIAILGIAAFWIG
jgi:hypothetical protein